MGGFVKYKWLDRLRMNRSMYQRIPSFVDVELEACGFAWDDGGWAIIENAHFFEVHFT